MLGHKRRVALVAGVVGALLGVVLSAGVTSPASALNENVVESTTSASAHDGGAAGVERAATGNYPGHVLVVTTELVGGPPRGWWEHLVLVRVNCSNNFDGDPSNNTTPGPSNDPQSPSDLDLVDGYVYLFLGVGAQDSLRVLVPDLAVCTVEQVSSGRLAQEVAYAATWEDPNTLVEIRQPPPGLGFVRVTWPTADTSGDVVEVTITTRIPVCINPPGCMDYGYLPTNGLRIKNRIRGDAPDQASFTLRLRCRGSDVMEERLLTYTAQTTQSINIELGLVRCALTEIDDGGAASVEYHAASATVATTSGPNAARVDFGDDNQGGDTVHLRVTNRFEGACPTTPPSYC